MSISIEPNVCLTARYTMNQTAEILGIHRNTLRRYSDRGLIKHGNRKIGRKNKFFLGREILRFWRIYM